VHIASGLPGPGTPGLTVGPLTARPQDRVALGLVLAVGAYALLAAQDATVKWLVVDLPVWQVLFCRSVAVVAGCLAIGGWAAVQRIAGSQIRATLLLRGGVTLAAWLCYFSAARFLPLGQLVTLWFAAPLFVVVLAVCFLGERVGLARWLAVALGFAGTVVAADPRGFSFGLAAALALLGALLWASGVILTRLIARQETSLVQMLASNVVFLLGTGAMTTVNGRMPTPAEAGLCLLVGAFGGLGQFALFEAFRRASASLLAPVEYTALPWAFLLGYMVWADVPAFGVFFGAGLIGAAGLGLVTGEWLRARHRLAARL
jgi:drug/metabolite transporter (DMT)-like permease